MTSRRASRRVRALARPAPTATPRRSRRFGVVVGTATVVACIAAVIAFAYQVGRDIEEPRNLAVCRSLDLTFQEDYAAEVFSADEYYGQRLSTLEQLGNAERGSDLEAALRGRVDSLDRAIEYSTRSIHQPGEGLERWFDLVDATAAVADACKAEGFELQGFDAFSSADGSISHDDAVAFCSAAWNYLTALADDDTDQAHLTSSVRLLTRSMQKGLPPDIYYAAANLVAIQVAAIGGEAWPDGEAAMLQVQTYCQSLDTVALN
jgi:hypothetical protein